MKKQELKISLQAGGFSFGELEHPNKMPFSGILTWFDLPSDKAVGGSGGKRVVIPSEYGVPALKTLRGMAVNFDSLMMDKHVATSKVGIIEDAEAGEKQEDGGVPVYVKGFIYAHDFPEEATQIKEEQADLGFSYETIDTPVMDADYCGEPVLQVCDDFVFSGAAILLAQKAAYTNTSLAASAEEEVKDLEIEKIVEAVVSALEAKFNLTAKADESAEDKTEDTAANTDNTEAKTEDAEEKTEEKVEESTEEKVEEKELNAGAEETVDFKAMAEDFKAKYEALEDKFNKFQADLKAEADAKEANSHKGFTYPTTLASKYNLEASADSYESKLEAVNARQDLSVEQKIALKMELRAAHMQEQKSQK